MLGGVPTEGSDVCRSHDNMQRKGLAGIDVSSESRLQGISCPVSMENVLGW